MRSVVIFLLTTCSCLITAADEKAAQPPASDQAPLAQAILADPALRAVHQSARALLSNGLNAGSGYGEVWIRDLNTFIDVALEGQDTERFREALLTFFKFQGPDGDIVDGYIPRERADVGYEYRRAPSAPNLLAHKNTVETDQETSLVQAVRKYVESTGDRSILEETIDGIPVLQRLGMALDYLYKHRRDPTSGLLWGATTADWGDVQPESPWGVELDAQSHRAIDIYDNAMFAVALSDYLAFFGKSQPETDRWLAARTELARQVRAVLWDSDRKKFTPHRYLGDSPFPKDFDEGTIYYHGGTTVAIEAGFLQRQEIADALEKMRANVRDAQAGSIGLTLFPPYPQGYFKNRSMTEPYSYQNGGDWCWFGGRTIQQLVRHGFVAEAYAELKPMVERAQRHGFHEWWSRNNEPRGSGQFRGSAGVLARAIEMLEAWAVDHTDNRLITSAGAFHTKTVGSAVTGGWNLFSEGKLETAVRLDDSGTYRVKVQAWGSPCQSVWPEMALLIDGEKKQTRTVRALNSSDYEYRVFLEAGTHQIGLAFLNDARADGEDRNLFIREVELASLCGTRKPVAVSRVEADQNAAHLEDQVVHDTRESIEKNRKGDFVLVLKQPEGTPRAHAKVEVTQVRHDFLFGCNIYGFDQCKTPEETTQYKQRFADLFNYATVPFYWRWYEPEPGKPHYEQTDRMVAWCQQNRIRMKGHPLLWGDDAGVPPWSNGQPSPERQQQRVREILQRYGDKIEFWEVVNEPAHLAEPRIDQPYRWAREVSPTARLIINDYFVLADGYPPFYRLLVRAIQDGVPFDGIGIQAHEPRTMRFPLPNVRRVLDRYGRLGKNLYITEFTPASSGEPISGSHLNGEWNETTQADYAEKFYRVCFAQPNVAGITWWDLCDAQSWLKGGGLLRADLSPKPAYAALHRLIQNEWHTTTSGTTDAQGRFTFRGYFGDYTVKVSEDPSPTVGAVSFSKAGPREASASWQR